MFYYQIHFDNLSKQLDTSKASIREELWPNLLAVHDSEIGGNPMDLSLSKKLNLTPDDHLSLYGIAKSKPMGMKIIEAFNEEIEDDNYDLDQDIKFDSEEKVEKENKEPSGTQFTLDSF